MPLFSITSNRLSAVSQKNFGTEKLLQGLIESNLATVFNCRFVASEFPTGAQHAGRIDTLALSEDDNPVIIEYKKVESSELITQSLYYLNWIQDHRGDFEIAAQKKLGSQVKIDWSDVRVICIAPNYRKYDLHAVQVMGANIELWAYRLFSNNCFYLEEVFHRSVPLVSDQAQNDRPSMALTAGKKAALTRASGVYTLDQHFEGKNSQIRELAMSAHDFISNVDPAIEVVPKKLYIAYKISQNLVCMEIKNKQVVLYLKLDPKQVTGPRGISRDVSQIGHYGTGDLEIVLRKPEDLLAARPYIQKAYEMVGS